MERKMKDVLLDKNRILFVSNDSSLVGGSPRSMIELIDEFDKRGCKCYVLLPGHGDLEDELIKRNIPYVVRRTFPQIIPASKKSSVFKTKIKLCINVFKAISIVPWLRRNKINIIHSVNLGTCMGGLLARMSDLPHVWHIREFLQEDHNYRFINPLLARKLVTEASACICVSKAVANKYSSWVEHNKIYVVYNGLSVSTKRINKAVSAERDEFEILSVGRITPEKGQLDIVMAINFLVERGIKNIKLTLVGSIPENNSIESYIKLHKLDKYVTLIGESGDVNFYREKAQIAITSSKCEAFGRVTVEAMFAGNLVIGTNSGGTPEIIVDGKTGFLYDFGNSEQLADILAMCIREWPKCNKIIDAASLRAKRLFSIKKCVDGVMKVYESIER